MNSMGLGWLLLAGILALIFMVVGVFLIRKSRRWKRLGDTPLCRKCEYNLIGNVSGRCPECGADITEPKAVFCGIGTRQRVFGWIGLLCVLLSLCSVGSWGYFKSKTINWYHYMPTSWVANDLNSSDIKIVKKAIDELVPRAMKDNARAAKALVDMCVIEQSRPTIQEDRYNAILDEVASLLEAEKLSDEQAIRFYEKCVYCEIRMRDICVIDGVMNDKRFMAARCPEGFKVELEWPEKTINGERIENFNGNSMLLSNSSSCVWEGRKWPESVSLGDVLIELKGHVCVFNDEDLVHEYDLAISKTVKAVSEYSLGYVTFVQSPQQIDDVKQKTQLVEMYINQVSDDGTHVSLSLDLSNYDGVGFAFRVYGKDGDRMIDLGEFSHEPSASKSIRLGTTPLVNEDLPKRLDVIFVPCWDVAIRRCLGDKFFGKALLFENVEIKEKQSSWSWNNSGIAPSIVDSADYGIPDLTKPMVVEKEQ